jgi:peroxiredoxin Q/BCP
MDDHDAQNLFATTHALDYPLLIDTGGAVAKLYGVKRALNVLKVKRSTFVIGVDQRIVEVITSELNMEVHVDRALAALRA